MSVYCFLANSAAAPGHLPHGKQLFERATFAAVRAENRIVDDVIGYQRTERPTITIDGVVYLLVGIDVDHYDAKRGGDQLQSLVEKLGPLSDKAPWISSSPASP